MASEVKVIKVAKASDSKKVAGTIKYYLEKDGYCELDAIGAGAVYAAVISLSLLTCIFKCKYSCSMDYFHFVGENGKKHTGHKFSISLKEKEDLP